MCHFKFFIAKLIVEYNFVSTLVKKGMWEKRYIFICSSKLFIARSNIVKTMVKKVLGKLGIGKKCIFINAT